MSLKIRFQQNWNHKLNNHAFTTIRLPNRNHQVDQNVNILLNEQDWGVAEIRSVCKFNLYELTEGVALLDTGYSREPAINLIKNLNWKYVQGTKHPQFNLLTMVWVMQPQKVL